MLVGPTLAEFAEPRRPAPSIQRHDPLIICLVLSREWGMLKSSFKGSIGFRV